MPIRYFQCNGFFASCEESGNRALHGKLVGLYTTDPETILKAVKKAVADVTGCDSRGTTFRWRSCLDWPSSK